MRFFPFDCVLRFCVIFSARFTPANAARNEIEISGATSGCVSYLRAKWPYRDLFETRPAFCHYFGAKLQTMIWLIGFDFIIDFGVGCFTLLEMTFRHFEFPSFSEFLRPKSQFRKQHRMYSDRVSSTKFGRGCGSNMNT